MAGLRNIKIGADISGAKQSLKELANILNSKEFKGKGAKIIDDKHIEYIKREGSKAIESMNTQLGKQDKILTKLAERAQDQSRTDKQRETDAKRYNRLMDRRLELQKDILKTQKAQAQLEGGGGMMGRMGGIIGKVPGMGGIGGAMAGGAGLLGLGGMALGGAVLGAGAFGFSRAMRGNQVFREGTQTRQNLRALNVQNVTGRSDDLQALGLTPEDVRQAQEQRARTFGGSAAGQDQILQTARISRMTGVSMEQFGGAAEALRSNLGVEGGQKAFAKLQASLLASGVEDALGPYLEQAANMLTSMNENGLSLSDEAVTLFSAVMGDGRRISAERASKIITGIDQAIKGASGETAGFIDFILSTGGVQGKGLLGQQLIREGGITGFGSAEDLRAKGLGEEEIRAFQEAGALGENVGSKQRVKALVGFYEQQRTEQGTLGALSTMQSAVGGRGLADTAQIMESLRTALESGDEGKIKDTLKKMEEGKMPLDEQQLKKLEAIVQSTDGTNQALEAFSKQNLDILGERIQPAMQAAERFLNSIDQNIAAIISWLPGLDTAEEKRQDDIQSFIDRAATGEASMTELKALNLSPEERKTTMSTIENRIAGQSNIASLNQKKIEQAEEGGGWLPKKMSELFNRPAKAEAELQVVMLKGILEELKKGNENTGKLANKQSIRTPGGANSGRRQTKR